MQKSQKDQEESFYIRFKELQTGFRSWFHMKDLYENEIYFLFDFNSMYCSEVTIAFLVLLTS